ncbi:HAD family hydrolase [Paenibacillus radicis (ex Xue et al. 2023)]|uniref:HAD family hydrolase n=1 Tax=Paenibacillus radicis (ex Xue et al. 2023) TaxID=2972489 RepID=A0ABT1YIR5_9BACL|nr:HAD family hydrolase [Paenibacillus radicis (ex Xue et al. 2023)]MCR8633079.1 HAD family hydrolase [Paenibacillus radicis (ex Xue et al. 2023)]
MKTKAIFFDLFETLITEFSDGRRISNRSYNYMELLGLAAEEFKKEWGSRQQKRMTGFFSDYPAVLKDILENRNLKYYDEAVQYLYQERIQEKMIPFVNIRSDIIELLENLRNNNIKIGLISNCTEEEVRYWHGSMLAQYFDKIIFSYEVGIAKPDVKIYQLACEGLSVTPEETIFVGDGGSNELDGANSAGLRVYHAIWFNTYVESNYKKIDKPKEIIKEI